MQAPSHHVETDGPRLLLAEHHAALASACTALRAYALTDDSRDLVEHYKRFERAVLEHLDLEETTLLPHYDEHAPVEAAAIRDDHAAIRHQLSKIGLEVELHFVRAETIDRLVDALRVHAAHEDATMYPWAERTASLATRRLLFVKLARSLRELRRPR